MKTGDLVMLSAYGKKISVNYRVQEHVGLVVEVQHGEKNEKSFFDVYKIMWAGGGIMWHIRKDLKMAKKTI
tara:strand:+ start:1762 stop:1974 length:213 start_codon:yes stop_codon:yes gene_type:complete